MLKKLELHQNAQNLRHARYPEHSTKFQILNNSDVFSQFG